MSRSIHTIVKSSHVTLALGAAALLATSGCIQPQPIGSEDPAGSVDLTGAATPVEKFHLLFLDEIEGSLEILIKDEAFETIRTIETDYVPEGGNITFAWHSESSTHLVTTRDGAGNHEILRLDGDASVSTFALPDVNYMYRIDETFDGGVIIAAEFDLVRLDQNGIENARDFNGSTCWTEVLGESIAHGTPVAADVMGATEAGTILGGWVIDENNPFTDDSTGVATSAVASNPFANDILGQDESGAIWSAGRSDTLVRSSDGDVQEVGAVGDLFEGAFRVRSVETASADSVYVLMDGGPGSQVGEVDASGASEVLFEHSGSLLLDMVVL